MRQYHEDYAMEPKRNPCWRNWVVSLLACFVVIAGGEIALRGYQWLAAGVPLLETTRLGVVMPDPVLGWRATDGYARNGHSQGPRGYRAYGAINTTKPKVLIVGDSFTHALGVTDAETYYATLRRLLPIEVFAYGAMGYGTLQEALIIEQAMAEIQPDLIVWQWCPNDFIQNHRALEIESTINNKAMRRPYWINGTIQYSIPMDALSRTTAWVAQFTRFGYYVFSRIGQLRAHLTDVETVERRLERGEGHPAWPGAVAATTAAVHRAKQAASTVPVVAFTTHTNAPYEPAFRAIAEAEGIAFTTAVAEAIEQATDVLQADQADWNATGHAIAGQVLVPYLAALLKDG